MKPLGRPVVVPEKVWGRMASTADAEGRKVSDLLVEACGLVMDRAALRAARLDAATARADATADAMLERERLAKVAVSLEHLADDAERARAVVSALWVVGHRDGKIAALTGLPEARVAIIRGHLGLTEHKQGRNA